MSSFISKETIEQIRKSTDIVALIGEYTKLESRGSDYWGCCPFHNEKTPSFHVEPDKNFYYCFSCHAGGDQIKFIMEQEKLSYPQTIEFLAKRSGIQLVYENGDQNIEIDEKTKKIDEYIQLYDRTATMFHYMLLETEQGKSALEYIAKRGLSIDIVKKFKLGYAPADRRWLKQFLLSKNFSNEFLNDSGLFSKKYPDVAFFSNRLIFPIFNRRGQAVAFGGRQLDNDPNNPKYLNSGDLPQYKKGETLYAFNFAKKAIKENKKVIFCEGYMDCIAYHQCGIEYAVAPLGTALTEDQIKIIRPFVEEVYLSFDSDAAGQKATSRAILMLRKANLTVKIIKLVGGKDPAEIMINFGKEALTKSVYSSILDCDFLLSKLEEMYPIDTPEGKTRAALAFFPYIDALQSDIQKESCLDQLCQAFNLKAEAVRKDFQNRDSAKERLNKWQPPAINKDAKIKPTPELRSLLAIIANIDEYKELREEFSIDDFEEPLAKSLFMIIDKCFCENTLSLAGILSHIDNSQLSDFVTSAIASHEYEKNPCAAIRDSIKMLKRKKLERKKETLLGKFRQFKVVTEDDKFVEKQFLSELMELDKKLKVLN